MVYERKTYKGGGGLEPPKPPSPSGSAPAMCVAIAALRNENKGGEMHFIFCLRQLAYKSDLNIIQKLFYWTTIHFYICTAKPIVSTTRVYNLNISQIVQYYVKKFNCFL